MAFLYWALLLNVFTCRSVLSAVLPGYSPTKEYIIEFHPNQTHKEFHRHMAKRDSVYQVVHEYNSRDLFYGTAVKVQDVRELESIQGVKRIWPTTNAGTVDPIGPVYESKYTEPPLKSQIGGLTGPWPPAVANQVTFAQDRGFNGKGIRVAIIDSGVNYGHPLLGKYAAAQDGRNCLGATCKTVAGYDFVGDNPASPSQDTDPDDQCNGHGTFIAGLIGAVSGNRDTMTGVAPGVRFLAYRVVSCKHSNGISAGASDSDVMAAFDRAINDGADIINMSIGMASGWSDNPIATMIDNIVKNRNIPVFVSAGNSGEQGSLFGSYGAASKLGISVGAYKNLVQPRFRFNEFDKDYTAGFYHYVSTRSLRVDSGVRQLIMHYTYTMPSSGCPEIPGNLAVTVATVLMIQLPPPQSCPIDKFLGLVRARFRQNIVLGYTTSSQYPNAAYLSDYAYSVFNMLNFAFIDYATVTRLQKRMDEDIFFAIAFRQEAAQPYLVREDNKVRMSDFSSIGPNWDFKDAAGQPGGVFVSAPGEDIASIAPSRMGWYAMSRGTSWASPYAAGCAALFFQARSSLGKTLRIKRMRQSFAQTAMPIYIEGTTNIAPFAQTGAGRLAVNDAINARTHVTPIWTNLGESRIARTNAMPLLIENTQTKAVTYRFKHRPALDLEMYSDGNPAPRGPDSPRTPTRVTVTFSTATLTVPAQSSARVTASFRVPAPIGSQKVFVSGYVEIISNDGLKWIRQPYSGVIGSFRTLDIIDRRPSEGRTGPFVYGGSGSTFNLALSQRPRIQYRLLAGTRWRIFELWTADRKTYLGRTVQAYKAFTWTPRSEDGTDMEYLDFEWSGTTYLDSGSSLKTRYPSGNIVISLSCLRPGADPNVGPLQAPQNWDVWWSPILTITRR
ncbi:hypothetical protein OIV83_002276 [Microbotryomycetes sp. JL201]|nr:hypothetical protein OIV83_002276 [Microbotryomycetes sp. JL201]